MLKVSPLLEYKVPIYPTYVDRSPLHPPQKELSKANYYKVALLGALGLFAFHANADAQTNYPTPPKVPNRNNSLDNKKENPIKFVELGFPHYSSAYGTGLPQRFDRETAVTIIDSVFRANEVTLEKDHTISADSLLFKATGYDPALGIGYVWLDWNNTASDAHVHWSSIKYPKHLLLQEDLQVFETLQAEREALKQNATYDHKKSMKMRQKQIDFFNALSQKNYYKLLDIKPSNYRNKELRQSIETYIDTHPYDAADDANYGKEFIAAYDLKTLNMSEMKKAIESEEQRIGIFSVFKYGFGYGNAQGKAQAIEQLENFVQDYIDWAKSEGRF